MTSITPKQESCLGLFMQRLQELLASSVVKCKKERLSVTAVFDINSEMSIEFDGYEEEAFVAFIATFRQFTMKNEQAVYFQDVCSIILDKCNRSELKDWINLALKQWNAVLNKLSVIQFNFNGVIPTNYDLLKLWLYSGRFHTDITKSDQWSAIPEMTRRDVEMSIQAMMPTLVNCLVIVGSVIRWWRDATTETVPAAPTC